jgi:Spy/CpxP family protein refolding chaperone
MGGYGPMMGYGMGMGMMHGGPIMGGMGMMPCPMMGGLKGGAGYAVELDEAQQKQMSKIQEQLWQQQQSHMQEMQAHQQEMMKLYQDGQPDSKQLLQAHKQMQERQLKLFEARLKAQDEMNKVLTEEQRQQIWQLQRQMFRPWQ